MKPAPAPRPGKPRNLNTPGLIPMGGVKAGAPMRVDFNRDIRPLLSNRCVACHGPDDHERKANLRLDTFEGATADRKGVRAVVPDKPKLSALIERITHADEEERMPPRKHGKRLDAKEIDLLTRWIEQGAPYAAHWAYIPPAPPEMPKVAQAQWPKQSLDTFVLARLEQEKLKPAPEADRATLIRRLSLDLTGLPPTPERVDAFLNDQRPDAVERLVDELLADPAYGERWASLWLDLARYADSTGYAEDRPRTIWAFRDYVIQSFNANKPFDQFTIEQLAGDLLAQRSDQPLSESQKQEWLTATAFHRNTLTNTEGGTDDEEFRSMAIVDRVNTTLAVWMGTTIACAQCHNHKYDPISQEEFFQVYAILNQTDDADRRDESPLLEIYTEQQKTQVAQWRDAMKQTQDELAADTPERRTAQAAWEQAIRSAGLQRTLGRHVQVRLPGKNRMLSLAEVQVFQGDVNLALKGKATQSSTDFGGPPERANDGNTDGHYSQANSTTHTKTEKEPWWRVDLGSMQAIDRVAIWNRTDGDLGGRLADAEIAILDEKMSVIWSTKLSDKPGVSTELLPAELPAVVVDIVAIPEAQRTDAQRKQMADAFRERSDLFKPLRQKIADLKKKISGADKPHTTVPIYRELPENKHRETFIQIRGNFLDLGKKVEAGLPSAFPKAKSPRMDRLTPRSGWSRATTRSPRASWSTASGRCTSAPGSPKHQRRIRFARRAAEPSRIAGSSGRAPDGKRLGPQSIAQDIGHQCNLSSVFDRIG